MEEKIYEMKYIINGEKYLITCTKVKDDLETTATSTCKNECCEELVNSNDETFEVDEDALVFSVKDIPEGINISNWVEIYEKYGIILTK